MPKPIHTEVDYQFAVGEIGRLWGAPEGSDAQDELEVWAILVDAYERAQVKPGAVDPVDIIKAEMDMAGRTKADLAAVIGPTRVSDILERRRSLSLGMIRALSREWGIPADLLIADYRDASRRPPAQRRGQARRKVA